VADNRTTTVTVTNHFDAPANVSLTHRHGDAVPEEKTWAALSTGAAGPPLTVHYQTGLFTAFDYWHVRVEVLEGREKGVWENDGEKECYLTEEDQGTLLTFDVSSDGLKLNMLSSSCTDDLTKRS